MNYLTLQQIAAMHAVYIADDYHDSLSHFPATTTLVGLRVLSDIRPTFAGTVAGLILSVQSNQFVQSKMRNCAVRKHKVKDIIHCAIKPLIEVRQYNIVMFFF